MKLLEFVNKDFVEEKKPLSAAPITTPSELERQAFLLNFPLTLNTKNANNAWMQKLSRKERKINYEKAFEEFYNLYQFMVQQGAIVFFLPNEGDFQDQVYVANLGIYLPHIKNKNVIILSDYTSKPRIGEEKVGETFFKQMKYEVHMSPHKWEGEADLKYLKDNVYIGGYGIRTEKEAFDWMEKKFNMKIVKVRNDKNPLLYHFDTLFLRLTKDKVLMPTEIIADEDLKAIEKYAEIIDIPTKVAETGCFNAVPVGEYLMAIDPENVISSKYTNMVSDVHKYMKIVEKHMNLKVKYFDMREFQRSGADIGCLILHLNYAGM